MAKHLAKRGDHVGFFLGLGQAKTNCPQCLHLLIQRAAALGQADQRLIGLGVLPRSLGLVQCQRPRQPSFLRWSLGALDQANESVAHLWRVSAEQFILRIRPPARDRLRKVIDQLLLSPVFDGLTALGCEPFGSLVRLVVTVPDAEDSAFVDLVLELGVAVPLDPVAVAPAEYPQRTVWADLDVAWLEEAAIRIGKNLQRLVAGVAFEQGAVPARAHHIGAFATPVVDEKHIAIPLWKLVERVVNHPGAGAVEKRAAVWCGGQVVAVGPIVAPSVSPAKVRAEERHENFVSLVLVVVRADEIEGVVHRHVPRVSKTAAGDLEVFAHEITAEDASFAAPVVGRVVVGVAIGLRGKRLGGRQVGRAGRRLNSPQFAEWLGGDSARLGEAL